MRPALCEDALRLGRILAELAPPLPHGAQCGVELLHVVVGVGEHETGLVGARGAVLRPLVDQLRPRLALGARPMDRALCFIDAERVMEIPLGHHLGRAPLVDLVLALHFRQRYRAIAILERAEHAAAVDAR